LLFIVSSGNEGKELKDHKILHSCQNNDEMI